MKERLMLWGTLALVLVLVNLAIMGKERTLDNGEVVLLELAPVDPRSLMQGDYMTLRYRLGTTVIRQYERDKHPFHGRIVITLGPNHVAHFVRFHDGEPLGDGELLLEYRKRRDLVLGANAFFFQEGHAGYYQRARYGELRVAGDGSSVLVGLRDDAFQPMGPPATGE